MASAKAIRIAATILTALLPMDGRAENLVEDVLDRCLSKDVTVQSLTRSFLHAGWGYAASDLDRAGLLMSEEFRVLEIYQFDFSNDDDEIAYRKMAVSEHPGHWRDWVQRGGSAIYPRLERGEGYFFLVPPNGEPGLLNLKLMRGRSITCVFTGTGQISSSLHPIAQTDVKDGETPMTVSRVIYGVNGAPDQSFTVFHLNKPGLSRYFPEPFIADFILMTSVVPNPREVTP